MSPAVSLSGEVARAIRSRTAVVALESTIITHGLPYPANVQTARRLEAAVRAGGATPATIGVLEGIIRVGLQEDDLERLGRGPAEKIQGRGLPLARAARQSGGTTVSATLHAAAACGIRVFATGGIGGVHRRTSGPEDVSEDLLAFTRHQVAVVSSGAKAILDLPRTLETLETLGVPVLGVATREFPAFYHAHSGLPIPSVERPEEVAAVMRAGWHDLHLQGGLLVCNPPPGAHALPPAAVEQWVTEAMQEAHARGIAGAALTPYLLAALERLSGGATVAANVALAESNAHVAAQIAVAYAAAHPAGAEAGDTRTIE